MSELIENQCPNCSATIKFDSKLKIMKCPYCDSEFRVSGTTVQDEVVDEVHPNYEKMYYAVFVDNLCTGLIIIALIIWIIELILGLTHQGEFISHAKPFLKKLSMGYFIIPLIVKFFYFFRINQLKDPRYNHADLILSIQSQIQNPNNPLNNRYVSLFGPTFFWLFTIPILLAIIF